jgi:hypothetical protein
VYTGIIEQMERDGLQIWDEIYPNEFFAADIEQQQLYVLERGGIAGAFALCAEDPGEEQVAWAERGGTGTAVWAYWPCSNKPQMVARIQK